MKKFLFLCTFLFFVIIIGAAVVFYNIYTFASAPAHDYDREVFVEIPKGASFNTIVDLLYKNEVISSKWKFQILGTAKEFDKKARAGEYQLNSNMTPLHIISKIQSGEVYLHRLTIPEGYTMKQIAGKIEEAGLGKTENFMILTGDAKLLNKYDIPAATMEGYLYPDTYYFPKGTSERAIMEVMLRQMQSRITPAMRMKAQDMRLNIHEVLTLASIVEKETGKAAERPTIASVFHNRMARGMRLESDPTAVYGVNLQGGGVTASHVRDENPYNTYKINGLPPTPIASPGIDSIKAVLYPADTKYFFFVAKGDGGHVFSTTYEQHQQAVNEWRKLRNGQQGN